VRILPATEKHVQWITERIHLLKVEDAKGIAAESDSGKILGVCMMDTWQEGSVQIHIAIDSPVCFRNHTFIREVFDYIFIKANRQVAVGIVNSDNVKALKFDKKLGFTEIGRIKDGHKKGIDTVLLELRRENCIWINHRKEAA
jgi:RimJ/RimL family protein N-acetyltransferase